MKYYRTNEIWHLGNGKEIKTAPLQCSSRENLIPFEIAEEGYKEYAKQFGMSQSLDRLNERGGFAATELCILLYERIKRIENINNNGLSK